MPFLIEIRIHGRGGQGSVTAAELIAVSAINEGKYAQAFPSFGPERRGAPVLAFTRVSDQPISLRQEVYSPDVVIVLDPTLLEIINVAEGLKEQGTAIVNTKSPPDEVKRRLSVEGRVAVVDATAIAIEELGVAITNTAILGAFVKTTGMIKLGSILEAMREKFSGKVGERNAKAAERAFKEVKITGVEGSN